MTPPDDRPEGAGTGEGPAAPIIERFGGIRPLAAKLGIPVSTVQGWKKRGLFPANRRAELVAAAAEHGVPLSDAELDAALSAEPSLEAPGPGSGPVPGVVEAEQIAPPPAPDPVAPAADARPAEPGPGEARRAGGAFSTSGFTPRPEPARAAPRPEAPRTEPPRVPPPLPPAPTRSGGGRGLAALALLVAFLALAASLVPLLRPDLPARVGLVPAAPPAPTADDTAVRQLRADLDALSARLQGLAGRLAEPSVDGGALQADIAALARRVDVLEAAPAAAAAPSTAPLAAPAPGPDGQTTSRLVEDRLRPLDERLVRIEEAVRQRDERLDQADRRLSELDRHLADAQAAALTAARTAQDASDGARRLDQALTERRDDSRQDQALVLAAGQLQAAVLAGRPYGQPLAAVRALGVQAPGLAGALNALQARADRGVPSEAALQARFPALAAEAARADRQRPDGSWTDQILGRLSSLVTVRRQSGDAVGNGTEPVLSRAGAALDRGDLDAAVAEAARLQGPAAAVLADWLEEARTRLAARDATALIADQAVQRLSTTPAPAPAAPEAPAAEQPATPPPAPEAPAGEPAPQ